MELFWVLEKLFRSSRRGEELWPMELHVEMERLHVEVKRLHVKVKRLHVEVNVVASWTSRRGGVL